MKFSLVMPAYNSAKTIAESIDTVLAQTYEDWELIVVNDGSVDATADIVSSYIDRDSRIRMYSQENSGTAAANNFGIFQAEGDYITIFPSDDWLMPEYLENFSKQINSNPGFDVYTANGWFAYEDGAEHLIIGEGLLSEVISFEEVIKTCPCSLGAMVKKGVHAEVGGYRKERYTEDYDFWLRAISQEQKFYFFDQPLVKVRVSKTQKSANTQAIHESDIQIMQDLLEKFGGNSELERLLLQRIEEIYDLMTAKPNIMLEVEKMFEEESRQFAKNVEKIVGAKNLPTALKIIHKFSFFARPVRWAIIRIRLLIGHRRGR